MNVLLDLAGDYFGGNKLPIFSNNFNANTYLRDFQIEFINYIENRLLISKLISKMEGAVKTIPWYNEIDYILYLNNVEENSFVGALKDRIKQVKNLGLTKVLRLAILGSEFNGIYIGVHENDTELGIKIAENLSVLSDREIEVPAVKVIVPNIQTDDYIERMLLRELDKGKGLHFINIIFAVKDNSNFLDQLFEGREALIHFVSNALDVLNLEKEK